MIEICTCDLIGEICACDLIGEICACDLIGEICACDLIGEIQTTVYAVENCVVYHIAVAFSLG